MAWLADYTYRKEITINGTTDGVQTDYQLKLLLGESSGATGEDVDCGGLCQDDFDDIRFTRSDGETLLHYWIESISGSTPNQLATIWIEFNSIPASPDTATFYMYYGNAGASTVSDGDTTFPFHDEFPGAAIDGSKWDGDTGNATVTGGILYMRKDSVTPDHMKSKTQFGADVRFRSRVKIVTPGDVNQPSIYVYGVASEPYSDHKAEAYADGDGINRIYAKDGSTQEFASSNWTTGSFIIFELLVDGGVEASFFEGGVERTGSPLDTNPPNATDLEILLRGRSKDGSTDWIEVDWVFVANFTATEPTWGAWGSEEQLLGPVADGDLIGIPIIRKS